MTASDIALCLSQHGCKNLTGDVDLADCSEYPVSRGGFGDVYRGKLCDGTEVAIKTIRIDLNVGDADHKTLKATRELYIWSKCQHPNILSLLGLIEFRAEVAMVSLWMEKGTLPVYLAQNPNADRCHISAQICEGLSYLHSENVLHGDLKGGNVLVSNEGVVLLNDFGNAVLRDYTLRFTATTENKSLSLRWAAPELVDERGEPYSVASDVYALGMTILVVETITGQLPYFGKTEMAVIGAKNRNEIPLRPQRTMPLESRQGDELWQLLVECWNSEPMNRPSSEAVWKRMYVHLDEEHRK
ncbi:Serine/threonine-protein kinase [Ceratobasidium sp. AG-Ba]|nr:Serine/threonine-protein kinase [Ceratobasidium sp. AG-Ba]